MPFISKHTWNRGGIEVIDDTDVNSIYFWLNEKNLERKIRHSNLPVVTNKYDPKYKKRRSELVNEPKHQPNRRFIRNGLAEIISKDSLDRQNRCI